MCVYMSYQQPQGNSAWQMCSLLIKHGLHAFICDPETIWSSSQNLDQMTTLTTFNMRKAFIRDSSIGLGELDNSPTWKHWSNPKKNPSTNHKKIHVPGSKILDFPADPRDLTKARAFELRTLGREKTRDRFWRGSPVDEWPKAHDMGGMVSLLPQQKLHH